MPELATLIREYYESAAEPIEVEEILERAARPQPEPVPPLRRSRWAIALATAVLIVVAIGLVVLLAPFGEEAPLITEPPPVTEPTPSTIGEAAPTTTAEDTTSTTVAEPPPPADLSAQRWARVPHDPEGLGVGEITGLTQFGSQLAAGGIDWESTTGARSVTSQPAVPAWSPSGGMELPELPYGPRQIASIGARSRSPRSRSAWQAASRQSCPSGRASSPSGGSVRPRRTATTTG